MGGVSKDEIMFFASMAMEGEEKAMEVCKSFLWSVLDKNGDGKLSSAELSGFIAEILQLVAKVAHCVVDTFATAFKGDVMQVIVGQAFANLDADNDGFIDEAELAMVKEMLEKMQGELEGLAASDEDDIPVPLKKMLDDDETFEELPIPPAILAKIREFGEPVMGAMSKIMDDKLETMTKCIFDICDANKDGQLDEDEFL